MGVPGVIRYLTMNYKNAFFWDDNFKPDYLFIDFNSIVHNMYFPTVDQFKNGNNFEELLINNVINFVLNIINKSKPKSLIYIAIDGVPPFAKLKQQRERRYKTVLLNQIIKNNKKVFWDKNNISPGTIFMEELQKKLKDEIVKKNKDKIIIFDDYHVVGEAEHKFLNTLRVINKLDTNEELKFLIYSPDADLLFLSLPYINRKIYLMKDFKDFVTSSLKNNYSENQEFIYLDIKSFFQQFIQNYSLSNDLERVGRDIMFLSFLEGNDFCPSIIYLKSNEDQMKTLFGLYKKVYNEKNTYLTEEGGINWDFFKTILKYLSDYEQIKLIEMKNKTEKEIKHFKNNNLNVDYKLFIEHSYFFNPKNPFYEEYMKKFIKMNFENDDYKKIYNELFFENHNIKNIVKNYFEALLFNYNYYLGKKVDYKFSYKYNYAPLPSSLLEYFDINNNKKNNKNIFMKPFEQLIGILPYQSIDLLPKSMKEYIEKNNKIKEKLYPEKIDLNVLSGKKFIYASLKIEELDYNELNKIYKEIIENIKLSKKENELNEIKKYPELIKPKNIKSIRSKILKAKSSLLKAPLVSLK